MQNGVLRRAWYDSSGREANHHLVTLRCLVTEILTAAHDNQLAGYFAERRTLYRTR